MTAAGPLSLLSVRSGGPPAFFRTAFARLGSAWALWAAAAFGVATVASAGHAQPLPSFEGVGDLPGGEVRSAAAAVSADGAVVVGYSIGSAGMEAFRWTDAGGLVGLGFLSGSSPDSEATGVSADGSVVAGTSDNGDGARAFRWTSGGGMVALGTFSCSSCDPSTAAGGLSGDGLVVVGSGLAKSLFGDPHLDASRWSGGGTGISNLGDLPGPAEFSVAHAASQTGATIVGEADSNSGPQGFWWTSGGGMQALVGVAGALTRSGGRAVSADASTVVGFANTNPSATTSLEAVRWTGAGYATVELLGALPGAPSASSDALAVNGDGSVVVGRARNAQGADRAFIWDAVNGMRDLGEVLAADYGLDLSGWTLKSASGVSDIGLDGEFAIVGEGTNPAGDPEGWVALLSDPACRNGDDDDLDGDIDFPDDLECTSPVDLSETFDCSDGIDNDGDGQVDHPADAGCTSATDATELPDCSDGIDNDGDGQVDHPADPGCASPDQGVEDPACDDGVDNDGDTQVDFGDDTDCVAAHDQSELPDCNDGLDNDADGDTDFPADADCDDLDDQAEAPECSDGIDNDADGKVDYPAAYPRCESAADGIEAPQCGDGIDNDGNGDTDLADPHCNSVGDDTESPPDFVAGDLLVVDRTSRVAFSVDPATGIQGLVSEAAFLSAPQGIAVRDDGTPVVADPAGLVEIDFGTGAQRLASPPLSSAESLQLVFPTSGDPYVLESTGISQVLWNPSAIGAKSSFLAVPTAGPIPVLGTLAGDTLALDGDENLLTSGFSLFGDGVFEVDTGTQTAVLLKSGFTQDIWLDLFVEDENTVLGVGVALAGGVGLHRIDATSGIATPFSTGAPFVRPVAVVVDGDGEIYVGDAGSCSPSCTGGAILHVDPLTGVATTVTSGGFIEGDMDLAIARPVPEPGVVAMTIAGVGLLGWLGQKRRRC